MIAAKRILRYLKGIMDFGLNFPNIGNMVLTLYADADYGRCPDTRRPILGILYKIGDAPIEWSSKRQPTVAMSTTEAEYRVLSDAAKNVVYLHRLMNEIGMNTSEPLYILSDNQSCIKLVDNPVLHARTKHIEIQYHFIRERTQVGDIIVDYIPMAEQQADILTKPLDYYSFTTLREAIGIKPLPQD
jgi:hypothetical protein